MRCHLYQMLEIVKQKIILFAFTTLTLGAYNGIAGVVATNGTTILKDDFTSDFALDIIRRAKSAEIKALLNTNVEPCDNFYAYACGNWHRNNPAQLLTNIMTDTFQNIAKGFDRRLLQILQKDTRTLEVSLESKVQQFYQSCKLVHRNDVHYKLALENVFNEFGEFPALIGDNWNHANFIWWQLIAKIQNKYGVQIMMAVDIMSDVKNNTENRVYIGPPEFAEMDNSKILNSVEVASVAYDLESYFGLEWDIAKKIAKELSELHGKLKASGSDAREKSMQDLLAYKTLIELNRNFSENINFTQFLVEVLDNEIPDELYIYDVQYIKDMLKIVDETPKRILANYILWQLLQPYVIDAAQNDITSWCITKIKKHFGKYIDHMVYAHYKSIAMEAEVHQVWKDIRNTFRDWLRSDKYDWISNATRIKAIEKLENMQLHINAYDNEDFGELYKNLTIDPTNYVHNVQQIQILQNKQQQHKLYGPPTTLEVAEILSFTPAYNILENSIRIPVALMQPYFFWNIKYPQALKYATLGYLIAHEMIHGFDDDGRNYDQLGNINNWWDNKSKYEFDERRKCFQAQYHNYKYGGTKLPESVLQSENIADNAGIKLAYAAYNRWLQTQELTNEYIEQQETLIDLPLNNRQLFFTAFAQIWCDDVQSLFKSTVTNIDTHAPSMYRVIGSLSNFQEFSWVFNCRQDAPMDPEFKCSIY